MTVTHLATSSIPQSRLDSRLFQARIPTMKAREPDPALTKTGNMESVPDYSLTLARPGCFVAHACACRD